MAFTPKTWVDRNVQYPGRRALQPVSEGNFSLVDVLPAEGSVYSAGHEWNAQSMNDLENRIAAYLNTTLEVRSGTFEPGLLPYNVDKKTGTYYKIGKLCFITIYLHEISEYLPASSAQIQITGLPFPALSADEQQLVVGYHRGFTQNGVKTAVIRGGSSQIDMWVSSGGTMTQMSHPQAGPFELRICGTYRVA